jgi:hypothetical protein
MPAWYEQPVFHLAVAVVLGGIILWRGLMPVVSGPETDFPNYYTASKLLLEGTGMDRCYDDAWFQEQMTRFGFRETGKFSPFPPSTALVLVPLAWMDPLTAFRAFTILNLVVLAGCVPLFRSIAGIRMETAALLVLASGLAIINGLRFGQMYFILALLLLLSVRWSREGKAVLSGLAAGLMIPVKYFPIVLVVWLIWERQWKSAGIATLTAAGITLLSVAVMGAGIFERFIVTVLPDHLQSRYSLQNPFATAFQSWDSLLMRLFVRDPVENPAALLDAPWLYVVAKTVILLGGGALVVREGVRLLRIRSRDSGEALLALLAIATLLFAPGTATYHFVLLWLPIGLLWRLTEQQPVDRGLVFVCDALIGWIPYSWLTPFERAGGVQAVLAYPRLLLMTVIFIATLRVAHHTDSQRAMREASA